MKLAVMAAILAVVACDKGEPAGTAQEITLRQTPSEVGDVVTTTEELGMEMTFRGGKDATGRNQGSCRVNRYAASRSLLATA